MRTLTPPRLFVGAVSTAALLLSMACPVKANAQSAAADQDHLVTSQALQQQVESSSTTRQNNIDTLTRFLSTPEAAQAMRSVHADPVQVKTAIPTLSDEELATLSARASHAQQQFAAGGIGPSLLTIIIIGIIVIIIVAIVH